MTTAYQFALTIEVDSRTAYEGTHTVPPSEQVRIPLHELPQRQGRVRLITAIHEPSTTESYTFEADRCYNLLVEYTDSRLDYFSRTDMRDCGTASKS